MTSLTPVNPTLREIYVGLLAAALTVNRADSWNYDGAKRIVERADWLINAMNPSED